MAASLTRQHVRRIGAVAGLAPALAALIVLVTLGASPTGDAALWFAGITVGAIGAGWLIGPRATGSFPSDLWTAAAFALVGSLAYVLVGTAISVWAGPAIEGGLVPGLAGRVAGQLAYGLLYVPFLAGGLTPFGVVWVVAVRMLQRRAGLPSPGTAARVADGQRFGRGANTRRMGLFAGALIVAYSLFVAVLPMLLYHEPRSPWWFFRPVALFVLFSIPAAIAAVGTIGRRRSLLIAAGVVCLVQSYVAFSLVTVGFLVPAILLLVLGAGERWPGTTPEPRTAFAVPVVVIALTVGAWVATLGLTEEVCWTSTTNPDGSLAYERVPVTDVMTVLPGQSASGCDGGTLTVEGMGVGAVLAIGAVAIAAASTWSPGTDVVPI